MEKSQKVRVRSKGIKTQNKKANSLAREEHNKIIKADTHCATSP